MNSEKRYKLAQKIAHTKLATTAIGYKVMALKNGYLVSLVGTGGRYPLRKGAVLRMPGKGVYLASTKDFVLDYYSGNTDEQEVLLELEYRIEDMTSGNLSDRETELTVPQAKIRNFWVL